MSIDEVACKLDKAQVQSHVAKALAVIDQGGDKG
jgi:hypothetical protein